MFDSDSLFMTFKYLLISQRTECGCGAMDPGLTSNTGPVGSPTITVDGSHVSISTLAVNNIVTQITLCLPKTNTYTMITGYIFSQVQRNGMIYIATENLALSAPDEGRPACKAAALYGA